MVNRSLSNVMLNFEEFRLFSRGMYPTTGKALRAEQAARWRLKQLKDEERAKELQKTPARPGKRRRRRIIDSNRGPLN